MFKNEDTTCKEGTRKNYVFTRLLYLIHDFKKKSKEMRKMPHKGCKTNWKFTKKHVFRYLNINIDSNLIGRFIVTPTLPVGPRCQLFVCLFVCLFDN